MVRNSVAAKGAAILLAAFTAAAVVAQQEDQRSDETRPDAFYPERFERSYEMRINGSPSQACSFVANRERGNLLFSGYDKTRAGELHYANTHTRNWTLVITDDHENGFFSELWFLPDEREFLILDSRCEEHPSGGSTMTIRWRLTGIDRQGNADIRSYFDSGRFERRYARMESRINETLAGPRSESHRN